MNGRLADAEICAVPGGCRGTLWDAIQRGELLDCDAPQPPASAEAAACSGAAQPLQRPRAAAKEPAPMQQTQLLGLATSTSQPPPPGSAQPLPPPDWLRVVGLLRQVARAMEYLHGQVGRGWCRQAGSAGMALAMGACCCRAGMRRRLMLLQPQLHGSVQIGPAPADFRRRWRKRGHRAGGCSLGCQVGMKTAWLVVCACACARLHLEHRLSLKHSLVFCFLWCAECAAR